MINRSSPNPTLRRDVVGVLVSVAFIGANFGANFGGDFGFLKAETRGETESATDADVIQRPSWTESKVQGTPDVPPPFALKRAYPKLSFQGPVSLHRFPKVESDAAGRMLVMESGGKLWSFVDDDSVERADLVIDFSNPLPKLAETHRESELAQLAPDNKYSINTYSMAFHPRFAENRLVYVCYVISNGTPNMDGGTHIARFRMNDTQPPTLDYESEQTVLRCLGGGHNGCTLEFGNDGYLYVSLGDASTPTPPDPLQTGQDIGDLLSSILRIDVDHESVSASGETLPYRIPSDNPFVSLPKARGEVFAYGFRNPWRMSFDSETGHLWVGDVGWEAYEMVYRVVSGGNYGWSITEGPGSVVPAQKMGPTPTLPPDIALSHADAASVTGGRVYRGHQHASLRGSYVFGDWITRRFWAANFDEKSVLSVKEIAYGEVKPIAFGVDSRDELLILEYIEWNQAGGIYRLVENPAAASFVPGAFPTKLSETGLFRDVQTMVPNEGVLPYRIHSTMWMEGADADFHVAVPGAEKIEFYQSGKPTFDWFQSKVRFPRDTVLVKTYRMGEGPDQQRIETQLSHYAGPNDWRFYSYRWLPNQTDAILVEAEGRSETVRIPIQGQKQPLDYEEVRWNFAARSECRICHTPWSGDAMGFLEQQLRNPNDQEDAWGELQRKGFVSFPDNEKPMESERMVPMAGMQEKHASVDRRARSYLHSNCAHCHQFGGAGSAEFDIRFEKSIEETKCIDGRPIKGSFQIDHAKLISPGDPFRSMLYYRMAKSGSGRMPHIGSERVDTAGASLIRHWIQSMPQDPAQRKAMDTITSPSSNVSDDDRKNATIALLATQEGSQRIANALAEDAIPSFFISQVFAIANNAPESSREFIEPFLPASMRIARLGNTFDRSRILSGEGDSERGRALVLAGTAQCIQCHQVGDQGKAVGPKLEGLATKYKTKQEMLEHLLQPSKTIAPEYRSISVLTVDGESLIGRLVRRSTAQLTLMLADGSQRELDLEEIEFEKENELSLMPSGLLSTLTEQQARDLLAFLMQLP